MDKIVLAVALSLPLAAAPLHAAAQGNADLAFHYAPVHYEDTDSSDPASDYITAFDYDGDLVSDNNWDHRGDGLWPATVHYSVVQSCTHWFVTYAFYHPRDWADTIFDQEHENDFEGVLLAVRKDGSAFGTPEGMLTVFHTNFYSYTPAGSPLRSGHENVDGTLSFENDGGVARPMTISEAKGHGTKAWPYASDFNGSANQDGVIYYPTLGAPTVPSSANDRHVLYHLRDIAEPGGLWAAAINDALQPAAQAPTFATWGSLRGNTSGDCGAGLKSCSTDSANAPWGWDDGDDGPTYRGEWALDPAHLFASYFSGLGQFSTQYVDNAFLAGLHSAGFGTGHAPAGFPSQLDLDSLYGKLVASCPAN